MDAWPRLADAVLAELESEPPYPGVVGSSTAGSSARAAPHRPARGRHGPSCTACGVVVYWANSAPTASAVVVDGRAASCSPARAIEPELGNWDLPGGFLEEGEEPLAGLRRELREETGLEVEPVSCLGAWVDRYGDGEGAIATLSLSWLVRVAGEPHAADDVDEFRWFAARRAARRDGIPAVKAAAAWRTWRRPAPPSAAEAYS